MTIPSNNLRACPDHRLVADRDHACPACAGGSEPRPDAVSGHEFTTTDLREQIDSETLQRLMGLLEDEAERIDGEAYVAVAEVDSGTSAGAYIEGAAGYTEQERWFNVAVIEAWNRRRVIARNQTATNTIETLEDGEPLIEEPEYNFDRLDPDEWKPVVAPHIYKFASGRVDDETLAIVIGSPKPTYYKHARKQMSSCAETLQCSVRTIEKQEDVLGNVEALIEVTIDD